jgi:hypothetical protein
MHSPQYFGLDPKSQGLHRTLFVAALFSAATHEMMSIVADDQGRIGVALRLKAALWLAGRRGKPGTREDPVVAMTTAELAEHPLLVNNDISRSKLDEILRLRREARPMELQVIAEALGLPPAFLLDERAVHETAGLSDSRRDLADALQTIRTLVEYLGGAAGDTPAQARQSAPGTAAQRRSAGRRAQARHAGK